MVGEACLPSNADYPRTPDYIYSGVHVCWSEHSDSSFVYGFMSLGYGLGTMTATTFSHLQVDCSRTSGSTSWSFEIEVSHMGKKPLIQTKVGENYF